MRKNYKDKEDNRASKNKDSRGRGRSRECGNSRNNRKPRDSRSSRTEKEDKEFEPRSNDPSWYYTDPKLADQVSQLAFQNLAGEPIVYDGFSLDVPNIVRLHFNPSAGVQLSANYNTGLSQKSGINMAGFKLYSRLATFTGRVQTYAPQDVSTMILAMGEIISTTEFIRRAFGVSYLMNMVNRDYPRQILEFGMAIDATDLFTNLSDYRTKFNTIITLINQLPIPKNIRYFDKCAALFESLYLDSPSPLAQTLVTVPNTTWLLDEASYSGGTILKTTPLVCDTNWGIGPTPQPLSHYLNILEGMVTAMLNSTTLHVVYTDILNMAAKQSMEFWRMDYLFEDYQVIPKYDLNFMLQMHNATVCAMPTAETNFVTTPDVVTPLNDVYPDPNKNALYYNPAFTFMANGSARTGNAALIDMISPEVSLTDRCEVTRYISIATGKPYQSTGSGTPNCFIDTALPDHYVCGFMFENIAGHLASYGGSATLIPSTGNGFLDISSLVSNIDWAPRFFEVDASGNLTGRYTGDVNYYTVVDANYIRKLHDFVGLALYDLR